MYELRCQITVVGDEQHACRVSIETPYWIDAFGAGIFYQIEHCTAFFGVVQSGDYIFGFVHKYIDFLLHTYELVVEVYFVSSRDNFCTQFCNDLSVNAYHSCLYKFVCLATRADIGVGDELIESHRQTHIDRVFVIFLLFFSVLAVGLRSPRVASFAILSAFATSVCFFPAACRLPLLVGILARTFIDMTVCSTVVAVERATVAAKRLPFACGRSRASAFESPIGVSYNIFAIRKIVFSLIKVIARISAGSIEFAYTRALGSVTVFHSFSVI